MTFTYDISTDVGRVRLEIGDRTLNAGVRPDGANFSDEEIAVLLIESSNDVLITAARVLEILSREWSLLCDITLGPRKESFSQVAKAYATQAAALRGSVGGGILTATVGFTRDDGYEEVAETEEEGSHVHSRYVGSEFG